MTIVVGYLPAKGGRASLDLAAVLARSGLAEPVAVVTVVPQHWATPSMAKVDAEFAAWAHQQGEDALDQAGSTSPASGRTSRSPSTRCTGRSVPSALRGPARTCPAICSCSAHRRTAGWVRSSSDRPRRRCCIPPRCRSPSRRAVTAPPKGSTLGRLTCSFAATEEAADLLTATAQMGVRLGCPLRIVTFGVRGRTMYPPEVGLHAEDEVLQQWREQVQAEQQKAVGRLERRWICCPAARPPRSPPAAAGARRWTRSTGRPGRSWSSGRRRSATWPGCSSGRGPSRSSGIRRCRWLSSRRRWPPRWPRQRWPKREAEPEAAPDAG